ncbi:MAG: hypothetical protein KC777_16450 [Cyanobacteria bacterium HKST-UBA02]|nr:hypothetical protein [Cyanobacteria bacterium HKST-UBA02]
MRIKLVIAVILAFSTTQGALADWRDDNPNKPNGYAASMARYHYGTPGGDEPANGYRATSIRSRNGLDGYLPPDQDDRWGSRDGDDRENRWGNTSLGRSRGGGLGRHFRQGVQEGQQMRMQGTQQMRMQQMQQTRMQEIQQMRARQMQMQMQPMANQMQYRNFNQAGVPLAGQQRLQAIRNGYANPAIQQHPIFNYYGQ